MVEMGFFERTKFVFGEVKQGLAVKELYSAAIFRTLLGTIVPSFSSYLYYYQINVTGFTQWQYSSLMVVGYVTMSLGSVMYNWYFKRTEF